MGPEGRTRRALVVAWALALSQSACAHAASAPAPTEPPEASAEAPVVEEPEDTSEAPSGPFDARAFARAYVAPRISIFTPSQTPAASLERSLRAVRDANTKRTLRRALVTVHLVAAESAPDAATRERERRAMVALARAALRGNRDARLAAELAFTEVWLAWISEAPDAARRAEAFFTRHVVDRELLRVDTLIRAELALAGDAASRVRGRAALSLLLGHVDDPLHAYASYRTARSYCDDGDEALCRQWLEQTRVLGCRPNAPVETRSFAERAFADLGAPAVPRRDRERGAPRYCSRAATASFGDPLLTPIAPRPR